MTKTKLTAAAFTIFATTFAVIFLYFGVIQTAGDEPHPDDDIRHTPQTTRDHGDAFDDPSEADEPSDDTSVDNANPTGDAGLSLSNLPEQPTPSPSPSPSPSPTSADIEALLDLTGLDAHLGLTSVQPLFTEDDTAIRGMYAQLQNNTDVTTGGVSGSPNVIAWRFYDADGNELGRAFSHSHVHYLPPGIPISLDPFIALDTPINPDDVARIRVDSHSEVVLRQLVELTPTIEWSRTNQDQLEVVGLLTNHSDQAVYLGQISVTFLDIEGNILHVTPGQTRNPFLHYLAPSESGDWLIPAERLPQFDEPFPQVQVNAHGWLLDDPVVTSTP